MILALLLALQETPLVLKDARVLSGGAERPKASVLVQGGKIVKVAEVVDIPPGARVIELAGKTLTPGLVEASGRLLRADAPNEEGSEVTPAIAAIDGYDPGSPAARRAAMGGVTTSYVGPGNRNVIGGIGAVVKTAGPERFTPLRERADLKAVLGPEPSAGNYSPRGSPATFFARRPTTRMGVVWEFRRAFSEAREGRLTGPDAEALGDALSGALPLRVAAAKATDLDMALSLGADFGLKLLIEDGREAWKNPAALAARKAVVILRPNPALEGPAGLDARPDAMALLRAAGVETALGAPGETPESLLAAAALAVKHGASRSDVLRALTSVPAAALGVSDRVGSIEAGKDADLVIFSGDPLDPRTAVERVLVNGRFVTGDK